MSDQDIIKKLEDWLNKTGYPLEMNVAKFFSERKIPVSQASYYSDYESNQQREIDIITYQHSEYESNKIPVLAELELLSTIECKAHQNTPWVFFKSNAFSQDYFDAYLANSSFKRLINLANTTGSLRKNLFRKLAMSPATGVTQAFSKIDTPYTAIMSTLKAADAQLTKSVKTIIKKHENQKSYIEEEKYSVCVLPIVVTDARLFEASLIANKNSEFKEVEYTSVVMRYPRNSINDSKGTIIYVFRESMLNLLVEALEDSHKQLTKFLPLTLNRREV